MTKTDYHHGDLRTAVLDAAEEELRADPRRMLSIRALAGRIGVSATAPHAHFKTKNELLAALAVRGFERLRDRTIQSSASATGSARRIGALAEAYLEFSVENAGLYRIMFTTGVDLEAYSDLHRASRSSYAVLQDAIAEAFPNATRRELDERALSAWSVVHGFASLLSEGRIPDDLVSDPSPKALAHIVAKLVVDQWPVPSDGI